MLSRIRLQALNLSSAVCVDEGLDESQGAHAEKKLEWGETQTRCLDTVCDNGLERGEEGTEEGEDEAERGKVIVTKGGESDTENDGD